MRTGLDDGPPKSIIRSDYQRKSEVNADLLAAAKAALVLIDCCYEPHSPNGEEQAEKLITMLDAAIKKAEG